MASGNITWKLKEGDAISAGDMIAEVETDKATVDFEAQDDGFLAKILVPSGSSDVPVGHPVAIIVEDESDLAAFKDFTLDAVSDGDAPAAGDASPQAAESVPPSEAAPAPSSGVDMASFPSHDVLGLPALSPTMDAGNIVAWTKAEGDEITAGDKIAEIETDKATVDFEAQDDGFLAKILMPAGSNDVPVNFPVAIIVAEADDVAAFAELSAGDVAGGGASAPEAAPAPAPSPAPAPAPAAAPAPSPTPAPAPAPTPTAPTPTPPAAAVHGSALVFQNWSESFKSSPVGPQLAASQAAYVEQFGSSLLEPVVSPPK